jgi:hypothetical protein
MINIFYNPNYIKTEKVWITRSFKYSHLYNIYIDFMYSLNNPIKNSLITSGPHKRMNNLVKTFKNDRRFSFNNLMHDYSYIVQFDSFGEKILQDIISNKNDNTKVLIGPLYNLEYDSKLVEYIKQYSFINKVVASEIAFINAAFEMGHDISPKNISVFPSGVISLEELEKNISQKESSGECIIYFKKRPDKHLELVKNYLEKINIKYQVFSYGNYDNEELIKAAKLADFGIFMSRPETQGFAAQELLSCNLPMFVWDQKINSYENKELSGTTMSYWDERCGILVNSFDEFVNEFPNFMDKMNTYEPASLIKDKLTYEKFKENLIEEFKK